MVRSAGAPKATRSAVPRTGRFGEAIIPTVVRLWRSDTGRTSVANRLGDVSSLV